MKKQHALSEQYFERLGRVVKAMLNNIEARRNKRIIRALYLNVGDLSPHLQKDIGLDHEYQRHNLR